jgi:hypothetical protein
MNTIQLVTTPFLNNVVVVVPAAAVVVVVVRYFNFGENLLLRPNIDSMRKYAD